MKQKEFVVGQWYRGFDKDYFIKFKSIEKRETYNCVYYSEKIQNGEFFIENNYWANTEMENNALNNPVSLEELFDFLPKDHPDRANLFPKEDPEAMNIIKNLLL